ncbi:MAG TPA: methionyl-tRNA formyltransferase [Pirellulales bacterium]|nr:methionyl-tRNA formyltransferase [Pirellulales bacterium]
MIHDSLRLIMMGTGSFAAPTFRALFDTPHAVVALVTQPARPTHRHGAAPTTPLRDVAAQRGTPVLSPESVNSEAARMELAALAPDLFVVADFGQILSTETLAVADLGGINLHGSLLPKYRGAAPINWAIYHGDSETGVTVIGMTPRVDSGPCLAQARTSIDAEEDAVELETRLAALGAPLVCRVINELAAGRAGPLPQDPALASPARRLRKTDGQIDWSRPAVAIKNQVRALQPWPKTYTFWQRAGGPPLRLILGRTAVRDDLPPVPPGTVVRAKGDDLAVGCGQAALAIREIQPSGKRTCTAGEFLRGYPVRAGQSFGPELGGAGMP